jgi:hypothetical protein
VARELVSPGRSRNRSNHCAGKAGHHGCTCVSPVSVYPRPCTGAHGYQPVPGLPCALRFKEGEEMKQSSGAKRAAGSRCAVWKWNGMRCEVVRHAHSAPSPRLRGEGESPRGGGSWTRGESPSPGIQAVLEFRPLPASGERRRASRISAVAVLVLLSEVVL